jgi:hypothetical protein
MAVVIIMIKRMTVVEMEKLEKLGKLEKLVVKEILLQLVNF